MVFTDRALVALVHLRTGLTYEALGAICEVSSSTVGRAISEIRALLTARGFAEPDRPGLRLRTLQDVFAYAAVGNVTLCVEHAHAEQRQVQHGPISIAGQAVRVM
ncbi:helix-turn-helix domain-containing protein [Streptomyces sp. NPDC055210]